MWEPHPKSYTRRPPNWEGFCFKQSPTVISQILLSTQTVSEAAVESAGLDQWQLECGCGGYSCLSLEEILILMYDYIFEEQWFPLFLLSDLSQHSYSSIQSSDISAMSSNPFAKINTILAIRLVVPNLAMKKCFLIWTRKKINKQTSLPEGRISRKTKSFIFASFKTGPKIP